MSFLREWWGNTKRGISGLVVMLPIVLAFAVMITVLVVGINVFGPLSIIITAPTFVIVTLSFTLTWLERMVP